MDKKHLRPRQTGQVEDHPSPWPQDPTPYPSSFLPFLLSLGEARGEPLVFQSLAGSRGVGTLVLKPPAAEARLATSSSWSLEKGEGEKSAPTRLLALHHERNSIGWHLPLLSTGVLAVMLLQQVVRWSVEGQALVLLLEAVPGTEGTGQLNNG